jgi:hypothetical protein
MCAAACLSLLGVGAARAAERVAVFDPELYDTSGEGVREDQQRRLGCSASGCARRSGVRPLRGGGHGASPRAPSQGPPLRTCPTCAPDAAAELGAELALLTTVHKVSNLILSITVALREASPGGGTRAVHSAEIRATRTRAGIAGCAGCCGTACSRRRRTGQTWRAEVDRRRAGAPRTRSAIRRADAVGERDTRRRILLWAI